ncbi:MAG TPA: Gx transporter family protein [Bacteroidota bacterium]|nr:Gx transporter family protein [Bacteroidota bacterium]
MSEFSPVRRMTTVALLSAVGIALFVIESYIPMPLPFLKIGLANVSSVVALMLVGTTSMMSVVTLRIVLGSLLIGTFMGPAFVLALSGGVASAIVMAIVRKMFRGLFGVIGISLLGAVTHVLVQLAVVRFVFVQNASVFHLLPLMLASSVVGGLVVGYLALRLIEAIPEALR